MYIRAFWRNDLVDVSEELYRFIGSPDDYKPHIPAEYLQKELRIHKEPNPYEGYVTVAFDTTDEDGSCVAGHFSIKATDLEKIESATD